MFDSDFATRFKEAMVLRGLAQADIARMTGYSTARINYWAVGRNEPDKNALLTLAEVLRVDCGWLLGLDIPMTPTGEPLLPIDESSLIKLYRQMNELGRERLVERAQEMSEMSKYTEKGDARKLLA
jgi:transcriptional regulator with XRE-family HTH domain